MEMARSQGGSTSPRSTASARSAQRRTAHPRASALPLASPASIRLRGATIQLTLPPADTDLRPWMAAFLKDARRRAGLSSFDAARLAGVTWQTIHYWEKGKHMPRADAFFALLRSYTEDADRPV